MADDPPATLDALAAIGYDEVEFAGYFGHPPAKIREWLDGAGVAAPAAHVGMEELAGAGLASLEAAAVLGHRWLVLPWIPAQMRTAEGYRAVADTLNSAGAAARDAGVRIAYHNHDFEFEPLRRPFEPQGQPSEPQSQPSDPQGQPSQRQDQPSKPQGRTGYDLLLERLDPSLVDMEIDFHWSAAAGAAFEPLVANHPGRFALCHLKDLDAQGRMADVGAGTIDWATLFALSEEAGLRHYFVEHDNPADPLASARASYRYLSQEAP